MKILFCIPTLGNGGAERQLSYLAVELKKTGHEVHVASSRGGPNRERLNGVQWHRLGGVSNHDPRIFLRLAMLMRKLQPDVVQTILTPMDIMGGAAALLTRTRWILKESSSAPLYVDRFRHGLRLALGRHAHGIVSNSAGGEAYWRSVRGARSLGIIPNAVPFDEIEQAAAGLKPGPTSEQKIVLFAGRLDSGKNVSNLIAALAQLSNNVSFIALICGDGPQRQRLERMARQLGIAHRIIFTGYVSNLWTLMKSADVFASLSRFEGCPNVVMEAMACGCPLVVSDIPAHREILGADAATFVNPDDPAAAARAIEGALSDGASARERATRALPKAAEWTVEQTARMYEHVYARVARQTTLRVPATNRDDTEWKLSAN